MLRKKLGKDPAKTTTSDVIKPTQIKPVANLKNQPKTNYAVEFNKPIVGVQKAQTNINLSNKMNLKSNLSQSKEIKPSFAKTEQEKLAQLVSRKAAELKRQSQLINKISSQVGTQKKNRLKQYKGVWAHALNNIKQKKQNKQNQLQTQQVDANKSIYQNTGWKQQIQKYLISNFKAQAYK